MIIKIKYKELNKLNFKQRNNYRKYNGFSNIKQNEQYL